jgi:predicted 3-demethylubiquinone-9 3-methyltransferase (glyoxalase superfamily)
MKRTIIIFLLLSLTAISFTDLKSEKSCIADREIVHIVKDSLKNPFVQKEVNMDQKIFTFMTFQKEDAEQAMNYYIELFDNSKVVDLKRWGKEGPGKEGRIMHATFQLNGKMFMCSDSPPIHNWDFTPAVSNYVECDGESELERLFIKLSENGEVAMPLANYGFSKKFGWVVDQFGVSWQLNLK